MTGLTKRQAEALDGSIEKWQKIVDGTGTNHGRNNCPCCQEFNPAVLEEDRGEQVIYPYDCIDCPIRIYTGHSFCEETPYQAYYDAEQINEETQGVGDGILFSLAKLAKDELDFLIKVKQHFNKG